MPQDPNLTSAPSPTQLAAEAARRWGNERVDELAGNLDRLAAALETLAEFPLPATLEPFPTGPRPDEAGERYPRDFYRRLPRRASGRTAAGGSLALTVSQAAALIAGGELAPRELIDALLARIAAVEPQVQAWAWLPPAESLRPRRWNHTGPLSGVPIGVKDIYSVAGMPTRAGSTVFHEVAERDAAVVARLRAAGAIIFGKTHTTQFAMGDPAPTTNPWNAEHTPGGSSSGSAAAVAAGMIPAALGTQTAGSILRPAAYCGVVGFKPTWGRLPTDGIYPLAWSLDHPGPLALTVRDAALLFEVMAGITRSGADDTDESRELEARLAAPSSGWPRIGVVGDIHPRRLEVAGREALSRAAKAFEQAGAALVRLDLPAPFDAALDTHHVIMQAEMAAVHGEGVRERGAEYGPRLRAAVETGSLVSAELYVKAQQVRRVIRRAMQPLFAQVDVVLAPAAPGPAPKGLGFTGDPAFNAPWSLLGVPCLSLPAGLSPEGLPLAVQLIAAPWQEARLLAAAAWAEQVLAE